MTILRLYSDNGHCAGFWVQHRNWPNACALTAACSASPLYAFRPRVVGRLASFDDGDTDVIVAALRRAGMVETDEDRHARLTDRGRTAARGLAPTPPPPRVPGRNMLVVAGCALCALIAILVGAFLLL